MVGDAVGRVVSVGAGLPPSSTLDASAGGRPMATRTTRASSSGGRPRIATLRGVVPICAWCKKIRDDEGYWKQLESYVRDHTEAEFSHGICPSCAESFSDQIKRATRD